MEGISEVELWIGHSLYCFKNVFPRLNINYEEEVYLLAWLCDSKGRNKGQKVRLSRHFKVVYIILSIKKILCMEHIHTWELCIIGVFKNN